MGVDPLLRYMHMGIIGNIEVWFKIIEFKVHLPLLEAVIVHQPYHVEGRGHMPLDFHAPIEALFNLDKELVGGFGFEKMGVATQIWCLMSYGIVCHYGNFPNDTSYR